MSEPLRSPNETLTLNRIVTAPVRPVMLGLVWPVLAEQFLNTLVALVDLYLAGNLPDARVAATSAVGFAAYVGWLVTLLFALIGTGTTALVARSCGADDRAEANHIANQAVMLALGIGVVASVVLYAVAPAFAAGLQMRGETYTATVRYLRIDALGYAIWSLTQVGAAALRGAGDMRTSLKVLAMVNILNVTLSPTLVNGWGPAPRLDVDGIVIGTLCARVGGGLLMLLILLRGRFDIRLRLGWMRPLLDPIRRILRIGIPAAADGAVVWGGHFLFLMIVGRIGSAADTSGNAAFAANIVVMRLGAFTYLPAAAWSIACATMIGQALGAKNPTRARRCGHEGVVQCGLLTTAVGLMFVVFAQPLCGLLNKDSQVIALAAPVLMLAGFFQPLLSTSIVYQGSLRGAGDTVYPLMFSLVGLLLIRVPGAYLLGVTLGHGLLGAWVAVGVDTVLRALMAFTRFNRGRWTLLRI